MNLYRPYWSAARRATMTAAFVVTLCSLNVSGQGAAKHPVRLEDLSTTAMSDSLQLSPDGRMIAYSFGHIATYLTDNDLWLVETKPNSTPRKIGRGTLPRWSPDGKRLAYYSGDGGDYQVWVLDMATGKSEQVTHVKGGINPDPLTRVIGWVLDAMALSWSPDGKRLAFASRVEAERTGKPGSAYENPPTLSFDPAHPSAVVLTATTPPEWTLAGIYSSAFGSTSDWAHWQKKEEPGKPSAPPPLLVNQLFIVDLDSKQMQQFTTDDAGYFDPDWSPDGTKMLCASSEGPFAMNFDSSKTNLYIFDLATRRKAPVTTGPEVKWQPKWSPDGKWISYLGGAFSGRQDLFVMSSAGGVPRNLSAAIDRVVEEYDWAHDSASLHALIQDGVSHSIVQFDLENRPVFPLISEGAERDHLSEAANGAMAWQQSDGSHAGGLWFRAPNAESAFELADLNPEIKFWELGTQQVIRWKNGRGEQIEGVLLKPVGYQDGHKYPLIVDCYPGTSSSFRSSPYAGNQAWASKGYAVLFTSGARAPHVWMNPFKSRQYDFAAKGAHGWDVTFDDVMSGVDEVVRRGIADPARIGLFGFSNGGAIAQMLITRTNRFRCAVAQAGVAMADLTRTFLSDPTFDFSTVVGMKPWDDPQGYVELSSVYRLNNVNTPVLLADGDEDGEFLLNTIEVYNGLRSAGKDVTFVRYPGQSHVLTGWALHDFLQRTIDFFDAHLHPEAGLK